jgi:L-ascorbate metabolism protein UlaG (beta-lactamase superfamily)
MPRYENLEPTNLNAFPKVLRWALTRKPAAWPKWVESELGETPPERVAGAGLRATFVNHATVLMQGGGMNLLTDPHWGLRCSPVSFAGPRRVRRPGLSQGQLPPLDAILLSHNHYDHMDLGTLETLLRAHPAAPLITGLGVARSLPRHWRPRAVELDWWQTYEVSPGTLVTYTPARHFSARSMTDRWKSRWGGFHVTLPGGAVYFAGDTGYGQHFRSIRERLDPIRLAVLPIGAYEPRWFMEHHHMNPFDAVHAFQDLGAAWALAMHYGTFQLADEGFDEPLQMLELAKEREGLSSARFVAKGFGEGWDIAP